MALWKPFRGSRADLDSVEKHDGYVYFCTDDGSLFFDYTDADGNLQRKQISAQNAESSLGITLEELRNEIATQDIAILAEAQQGIDTVEGALNAHIDNDDVHVTTEEKYTWNTAYLKTNGSNMPNDFHGRPERFTISGAEEYTVSSSVINLNADSTLNISAPNCLLNGAPIGSGGEKELPDIDPAVDEGKVLGVVGGVWNKITIPTGGSNAGTSQSDIFPYQKVDGFAADASFGGAYSTTSPVSFEIKEGETYYVEWDGGTYPCECKGGSFNNMPILYLGNDSLLGGTSDEPFTIGYYTMLGIVGFIAADNNTSHDVRIYQVVPAGQSDWAQNDNTQPDYIKNRPFYETLIEQSELLAPTELTFTDGDVILSVDTSILNKWLEDWTIARVTWDGVVYECEPQIIKNDKLVGNTDALVGGDSGLPFLVNCYNIEGSGAALGIMAVPNHETESTHEVSISVLTYSINHLDTKFIKSIPWKKISDKPFDMTPAGTIVAKGTETFAMPFDDVFAVVVDEITLENNTPYIVEFDGSSYQVTTTSLVTETDASIYYENEGVFFAFFNDFISGSTAIVAPTLGVHTYKITVAEDIVKKIDPVYLPDNLGGLPEVTTADAGKFLRVSAEGAWAVEALLNAEEVSF